MKPMRDWYRYKHKCRGCRYVGTGHVNGEQTDWYLCQDKVVVARTGDEPHSYWSTDLSVLQSLSDHGSTYASAALAQPDVKRALDGDKGDTK